MTVLQSIALLLSISAFAAFINQRFLKLPQVIALNILSIFIAVTLVVAGYFGWSPLQDEAEAFIQSFDFSDLVLHGILCLLLFAGAVFVNAHKLYKWKFSIISLATLGVVISTFVIGAISYYVAPIFGLSIPFLWCLLFGAAISPTDPIAALAIVQKANAPKSMEIKLVGESLSNDGTGVMLFLIISAIILKGEVSTGFVLHELLVAPFGGIAFGLILGFIATYIISQIDHHPTEILVTLALATSSYGFSEMLHLSAPLAVVASGLVIGYKARMNNMSEKTREHLDVFWETLDEIVNAALFVLIGLELIVIDFPWQVIAFGVVAWLIVLIGRAASVYGSLGPLNSIANFGKGTSKVMIWGGLRGGISLALVLSLPPSKYTSILIGATFIVVIMSGIIQGLTLHKVIPKQIQEDSKEANEVN